MLHGMITEKVTPRCNPGPVAAERNSFKEVNLNSCTKVNLLIVTQELFWGWSKFLIPKPLIWSSCLWRKTSQPCHFSPSGGLFAVPNNAKRSKCPRIAMWLKSHKGWEGMLIHDTSSFKSCFLLFVGVLYSGYESLTKGLTFKCFLMNYYGHYA